MHLAPLMSTAVLVLPSLALAFPPYRSTDADTASPGVLEARVGLLRVQRDNGDSRYAAPLLRLNLGITRSAEISLESEYDLDQDRLGDGALGLKLVSHGESFSCGWETLALLPVNASHSGAGIESQLIATWKRGSLRMHFNAGGFHDPRASGVERGWRASILTEVERTLGRPGLELFARDSEQRGTQVQLGAGWIVPIASFELRIGLHTGLSGNAPDIVATLWVSTQRQLWNGERSSASQSAAVPPAHPRKSVERAAVERRNLASGPHHVTDHVRPLVGSEPGL